MTSTQIFLSTVSHGYTLYPILYHESTNIHDIVKMKPISSLKPDDKGLKMCDVHVILIWRLFQIFNIKVKHEMYPDIHNIHCTGTCTCSIWSF